DSGKCRSRRGIRPLLDFHLGARFFELLFGGIRIRLVRSFEHRLRRAFHQRLGFRQAESGLYFAHGLDGGNFLVRRGRHENHVERVLHGGRRGRATGSRGGSHRHRRGGGHAPFFFQFLHQVGGFENRQLAQFLYEVCYVSHVTFPSSRRRRGSPSPALQDSARHATALLSPFPNRRFTLLFLFVCPIHRSGRTGNGSTFLGLRLDDTRELRRGRVD